MDKLKTLSFGNMTFQLAGNEDDVYYHHIEHHVAHNNFLLPVMKYHLSAGSTILDIGANVGLTTMLAYSVTPQARIISVEPSSAYEYLVESARVNGLVNHTAVRCCIGDYDGEVFFAPAAGNLSASHMLDRETAGGIRCPVKRVDTLIKELDLDRLDLIKIDVEGHETSVLDGMQETDRRFEPLVFMEFNAYALTANADVSPRHLLHRILSDYGCFVVNDPAGLRRIATQSEAKDFLHANMIEHSCVDDILFTRSAQRLAALQV